MRTLRLFCIFTGLLIAAVAMTSARAQEQPPAAAQPGEEVGAAAAEPEEAAEDDTLREQTIYIPYDKLRRVFEREGRGVFLPYEKFQELWKQARAGQIPEVEQRPPVGALISEIENEAVVQQDLITVNALLNIEILGKGWHKVPLRLADAAIRSATIGGESARVISDPQAGYQLLVYHPNEEAARLELQLEYAKAFSKSPGQNSVSFQAPRAPVNRWRIQIPQPGVKVNIQPLIAATEAPAEGAEDEPAQQTVVLAFVGAATTVRIDWTPKAEGATGLEALATVEAQQEVAVEEGVVRTRTRLAYEISRAELSRLLIEVPADQKVTGVFDPNVRQWEVAAEEDRQTITVQLFEPTRGTQHLTIELERFANDLAMSELSVPVVRAVGVGRQQGVVVVRIGNELRAETTRQNGLLQLDASELPEPLRRQKWLFAYRYSTLPFDLALNVEKVQPRILADQLVEAYVEPQQTTLDLFVKFDIQRAGVFQLEFDIPSGYDVSQVRGQEAAGAAAVAVDTYYQEGEDKTRLKVNLARKALGPVGVLVELKRTLDDPNLLSPTGESSEIPLPLPRVATDVEQLKGRLIVYAPESLRVNPQQQTGVRSISFSDALQGLASARQGRFPTVRQVLAFAHTQEPVDLSLSIERRQPFVTARQLLVARIESGVVKYEATFFYDVLYSGVQSLRIDVPENLAADIRNRTPGIRDTTLDPQPDDVAEGDVAWGFTGETELLGSHSIRLTWEQKSDELEIGKSVDFEMPVLRPADVDRAWGQVVVAKAETLEVQAARELEGLRPIDPQHDLMPGAAVQDAARAFEFHDDWSLTITATRYELEEVKRTSVERALLRMVVTRSDRVSVQALYRLRSAVQRLAIQLPAGAEFDPDPLRINGVPKGLETGDQDQKFIPLADQEADKPLLIELRYTVPGDHQQLDLPVFPDQPPVQSRPSMQKVQLSVYLPDETLLLGSSGPWTNEYGDWYQRLNGPPRPDDDDLLQWVSQDVAVQNNHLRSFSTDGRLYRFTSLRPAPPPDGSLRLTAMHERMLDGVVFGALAVVGLLLLRQSLSAKMMVLALLLILLVLAGVFAPTFAMQILDVKLAIGIGIVLLVWLVAMAAAQRPVAARAEPTPPPVRAASPASVPGAPAAESTAGGDSPFSGGEPEQEIETEEPGEGGTSNA